MLMHRNYQPPNLLCYCLYATYLLYIAFEKLPDSEQISHVQELVSQEDDLISIDSSSS